MNLDLAIRRSTPACLAVFLSLTLASPAQVPTAEERVRDSTLSPEYYRSWRTPALVMSARTPEPPLVACYRRDFELPAAPRHATLCLLMNRFQAGLRGYHVVVNGAVLAEPRPGQLQLGVLSTYDLTERLKPGRNVLTVKLLCRDQGASLMAPEGIVFCRDGTTIRLLAEGWRGGWNLPDGWDAPESDPSALPEAPAKQHRLAGRIDNVTPRPYIGPIRVQPLQPRATEADPIFDDAEPVRLAVTLLNLRGQAPALALTVSVLDEESRRTVHDGALPLAPAGELDLAGSLDLGKLPQGAYRVRFILSAADEELDRRDFEIACVGRIPQRVVEGTNYEDGMDLKPVWTVDCTAEPSPDTFIATTGAEHLMIKGKPNPKWREVETRVVDGPAGRYRELAEKDRVHNFAYKYTIERVYVPHLAVVEWPDDAARNILVHIKEPGITVRTYSHGYQRSDTAIRTTHDLHPYRPSNQLKKLHLLFWPNAGAGSIHVMNIGGGDRPAAAARITVYEITNDLPAFRITEPSPEDQAALGGGPRLIGPHTERGPSTMGSTYYAGPLGGFFFSYLGPQDHPEFYRNWFSTTANWIKAARFSGQNLYLMGHFMVTGTLYPSAMWRYGYDQNNYLCGDATRDYAALVLRMFEQNGMKMISNIEHLSFSASSGTRQPTPEEVRAGAEHCYMVSREGTLFPLHAARYANGSWTGSGKPRQNGTVLWPALNHMHPEVLERYLALLGELADRYGRYPAWKGVNLMVSRCMGPMDPAHLRSMHLLEAGYEDFTINRFQAETGIAVPVDPKAPDRFEQRYQWLTTHAREPWIAWRCAKYTDFFRALRDRIAGRRDDVKLYLIIGEPMLWTGSQEILDGRYEDTPFVLEVMRQFGFDLQALKREPGIVLNGAYAIAGSAEAGSSEGGWREQVLSERWQEMFANDGLGGAFLKGNIPHVGAYEYPKDRWLFTTSGTRQGWYWSTYVNDSFVNVMARSNPTWIPHTWMDVCESMGRLHEKRPFARAYRSLPNARYERLTGNGRDRNIWISCTQPGPRTWAYAANLNWWRPRTTLVFAPGTRVHDLIADKPVALDRESAWTFTLEPYAIQSFRMDGGALRSAATVIPAEDRAHVEAEIQSALDAAGEVVTAARARASELEQAPEWAAMKELEGRVARVTRFRADGELADAYALIHGAMPIARETLARLLRGEKLVTGWL